METKTAFFWLFVIGLFGLNKCANYVIPEVTLTAYSPKGFSASIPDNGTITQFAFHANVNTNITQLDPGSVFGEADEAVGHRRTYFNPDLELNIGDKVYYWVFVQTNFLGFKQENKVWTVPKLEDLPNCRPSSTSVTGNLAQQAPCKNALLFTDDFDTINEDSWLINQYIPYYDQNYEFVSYEKSNDVLFNKDGKLFIKPTGRSSVYGSLDFGESCTRQEPIECKSDFEGQFIVPPVISAKLTSKFKIKYGKIEIKAKLPFGDWIYPELTLQSENTPHNRIFIAYARGNDKLWDTSGKDYGSRLLFGGPTYTYTEPDRSQYLRTKRNEDTPFTSEEHTFTALWGEESMQLLVDDDKYGEVMNHQFNDEAYLVLGVGVGGVNDFPDNFTSGSDLKPWTNGDPKQVTNFYLKRDQWDKTWVGDNVALQVNSIKIWAI